MIAPLSLRQYSAIIDVLSEKLPRIPEYAISALLSLGHPFPPKGVHHNSQKSSLGVAS